MFLLSALCAYITKMWYEGGEREGYEQIPEREVDVEEQRGRVREVRKDNGNVVAGEIV